MFGALGSLLCGFSSVAWLGRGRRRPPRRHWLCTSAASNTRCGLASVRGPLRRAPSAPWIEHTRPAPASDCKIAVVPGAQPAHRGGAAVSAGRRPGPKRDRRVHGASPRAFARVNRNHDIVLVDQRGTGKSALLSCDYPEDWQSLADALPALRKATVECLRKYGDRGTLLHHQRGGRRPRRSARVALGYAAIDLYGVLLRHARRRALHAALSRASVHAAILDGVTYPEQAIGAATPQDGERALDLIVARCAGSADCAAAYPQLRQDLDALRRRFGAETARVDPRRSEQRPAAQDRIQSRHAECGLRFLSYSSAQASLLPTLIHRAGARRAGAARGAGHHDHAADQRSARERHAVHRDLQRGRAVFRRGRHRPRRHGPNLPGDGSAGCAAGDLQAVAARAGGRRSAQSFAQRHSHAVAVGRSGPGHSARGCRARSPRTHAPSASDIERRGARPGGHRLRAAADGASFWTRRPRKSSMPPASTASAGRRSS